MKKLHYLPNLIYIYSIFPLIVYVILALNSANISNLNMNGLLGIFLQSMLLYGILAYLHKYKYIKFVFVLFIVLNLFTVTNYHSFPSVGIIMSIINTSVSEVHGFMKYSFWNISISLLILFGLIFLPISKNKILNLSFLFIGLIYIIVPVVIFFFNADKVPNGFIEEGRARGLSDTKIKLEYVFSEVLAKRFRVAHGIKGITDTIIFLETNNEASSSSWSNVTTDVNTSNLLIIGLGESLRADHLGIYGYKRNTTPLLSAMKNKLYTYHAYSGGTNTWTSVPTMFTKFNLTPDLSKSIINLANDAGYKTYWLSNQTKTSAWDFSVSSIALQSNYVFFNTNELQYDSILLPKLLTILKDREPNEKTLIMLHFYGSHMYFKDRYPLEYSKYNGGKNTLDKKIDEYDNTVLYTDYIISKIFKISSEYNAKFIYFSDHGLGNSKSEIPFDHDVRKKPSIDSVHVPLISNYNLNLNQPVNLFYFECIFSDWAKITAFELDKNYCKNVLNLKEVVFYDAHLKVNKIKLK